MQWLAKILTVNPPSGTDRHRVNYTMVSNYPIHKIIPTIQNCVAKLILLKMERETMGYHQDVVAVSLEIFRSFYGLCQVGGVV